MSVSFRGVRWRCARERVGPSHDAFTPRHHRVTAVADVYHKTRQRCSIDGDVGISLANSHPTYTSEAAPIPLDSGGTNVCGGCEQRPPVLEKKPATVGHRTHATGNAETTGACVRTKPRSLVPSSSNSALLRVPLQGAVRGCNCCILVQYFTNIRKAKQAARVSEAVAQPASV